MLRAFIIVYAVIGTALMFAVIQLHITAAQMHLLAEERYQNTLHRVCPKQPTLPDCKDLGRKNWEEGYERWIVKFAYP